MSVKELCFDSPDMYIDGCYWSKSMDDLALKITEKKKRRLNHACAMRSSQSYRGSEKEVGGTLTHR